MSPHARQYTRRSRAHIPSDRACTPGSYSAMNSMITYRYYELYDCESNQHTHFPVGPDTAIDRWYNFEPSRCVHRAHTLPQQNRAPPLKREEFAADRGPGGTLLPSVCLCRRGGGQAGGVSIAALRVGRGYSPAHCRSEQRDCSLSQAPPDLPAPALGRAHAHRSTTQPPWLAPRWRRR